MSGKHYRRAVEDVKIKLHRLIEDGAIEITAYAEQDGGTRQLSASSYTVLHEAIAAIDTEEFLDRILAK